MPVRLIMTSTCELIARSSLPQTLLLEMQVPIPAMCMACGHRTVAIYE